MIKKNSQISTAQFMFAIACFMQGSSLLTFAIHETAKQEAWIAVVIGCLISLPFIWIYVYLAKKHPGKDFFAINEIVLGRIAGKLFSTLYLFYFFTLVILNSNILGNFVSGNLLPITPMPVALALFIFICSWAVCKGVRNMTSYGTLFVIITVSILLFSSLLLIKDMKFDNLLPIFSLPLKDYLEGAHITAVIPICEMMVFLMLLPNLQNSGGIGRAFWGGAAIGAATLLFIVLNDTVVLGKVATVVPGPPYTSKQLINIGNVLTHMEVLYAVMLLMLLFFKISIIMYAFFYGLSRLLNLKSYRFLVATFGVIFVIFSSTVFTSADEHANWIISGVAPVYLSFFLFVLPACTMIVAVIRNFMGKKGVARR